ncbi:hypothetical protein [uncultured Tateyamaria sp.]|uniref:hypothetical protein n=1 Tax=Tateyamaria sp. 1078 TaxID=3417464 RepID=UPI0026043513|nr:hypothetical protein [uncultured Tateyamaria sp.]
MTQTKDRPQANDVAEQLGILRDDFGRLASMIGDIAADKAQAAKETAQSAAAHIATDAKDKTATFRASAGHAYDEAEASVRRNPALAAAVAAGAGLAVARFVFRRRF